MKKYSTVLFGVGVIILLSCLFMMNDARYTTSGFKYEAFRNIFILTISSGIAITITGAFALVKHNNISNYCSFSTTLLALGMSAAAALAFYCGVVSASNYLFAELGKHPFSDWGSAIVCILSTLLFITLFCLYCKYRGSKMSSKGVIIDIMLLLLYFIPFFYFYYIAHNWISDKIAAYYVMLG